MFVSIVIGWAAELIAVHLSAGMALAVLAWLQTSPEFAVEASIAWSRNSELALANLTGSLRLLLGLGWPVISFIFWYCARKRRAKGTSITLPRSFSVEAAGLTIPIAYFLVIVLKSTWSAIDGIILCLFYVGYFWALNRARTRGTEVHLEEDDVDEPWLVRKIQAYSKRTQLLTAFFMFLFGGIALYFTVHPFVESLRVTAVSLGITEFVFIQWMAPIASEFPEKVTAFNWARRSSKAPMAIVNMLSSVTSQWTLLAGLVPIIFSISAGHLTAIDLTEFQKTELLLTIAQSVLAVVFMADLKIYLFESVGLFVLWLFQFLIPDSHHLLIPVYALWALAEGIRLLLKPEQCIAWIELRKIVFGSKRTAN
jgi:cation:H+ antiporter